VFGDIVRTPGCVRGVNHLQLDAEVKCFTVGEGAVGLGGSR
jgi:hypothetical protein